MSLPISSPFRSILPALVLCATAACSSDAPEAPPAEAEEEAAVAAESTMASALIMEPTDGAVLPSGPVRVVLSAENIAILPAGDTTANSGHHHLVLNATVPPTGEAIPAGQEGYVHLGQAQTEHTFEALAPGDYTLIAVIGDLAHRVIPQASDTVRFTVSP
jgi:hypothetical protein